MKKKNVQIIIIILIAVLVFLLILSATGIFSWTNLKKLFSGKETEQLQEERGMNSRQAYDTAIIKAKEWKEDAKLADMKSVAGKTGASGFSDNWELIFVSPSAEGKGYFITLTQGLVSKAEEAPYIAEGAELPGNIISAKEAIARMRQIKGYETEPVISVEMLYDPSGIWYWGIKTSKGTVSVEAR